MSAPAGWYPDPQTPVPGSPPQQRYWDGQGWTAHVAPVEQQPAYPTYPAATAAPAYGATSAYEGRATTPDGVPLAGWWHRVGAYVIDFLILGVVIALLALPFIRDLVSAVGDYIDVAIAAGENGSEVPSMAAFQEDIAGPALAIALISLAANLVYTVGFLMWKQATPGKLAVGLRIRLRESPGLPLPTILTRFATQTIVPGVFGLVPVIGILGTIFSIADGLWPLWDIKKQAIHDKVAKTNVIRVR